MAYTAGSGSRATLVHGVDVVSQDANANTSYIHVYTYVAISGGSGITNNVGDANWNVNTAGSGSRGANFTYSGVSGTNFGLDDFYITVGHDVNGNCTVGYHAYANGANSPYWTAASIDGSQGLSRLAKAPGIAGIIADTIKTTSVRLGGEITDFGHGTGANMNMYYRLQGSGTWIDLGNQTDAAGYNYWNVTGLQANKTYEYMMNVWNNNGDGASSSVSTFKTQAASGMIGVLAGLM